MTSIICKEECENIKRMHWVKYQKVGRKNISEIEAVTMYMKLIERVLEKEK